MGETQIEDVQKQSDVAIMQDSNQPGAPQRAGQAIIPQQSQYISPGAKATNIIMQDHRVKQIEFYSESAIPQEIKDRYPIQTMMIDKRAIGFETELDILANDIEYDIIDLIYQVAGNEVALPMALSYLHHREGLRAFKGSERRSQVTTIAYEESRSHLPALERQPSMFQRARRWLGANTKKPTPQGVYGPLAGMA